MKNKSYSFVSYVRQSRIGHFRSVVPVKTIVSRLLPHWRFEVIAGATSLLPIKPDPAAALRIARRMRLKPGEFLYLGDSAVDMKTATAAGMYPVGALWGFRPADELRRSGAEVLITQPSHLLRLLHKT